MSRRVSLPGADELFRTTSTLAAVPSQNTPALAAVADESFFCPGTGAGPMAAIFSFPTKEHT